jgi:lipopolysaccharide transport system ATP-binding protein
MSEPEAINVERLSKRYRLGESKGSTLLRDSLSGWLRSPIDRLKRSSVATDNDLWALRDVSFSIKAGEAVGIVGRNGSGKSTLLKLISRITEPSGGKIRLRGRVASLLEVGTGFHPDLTGRENIFLNGAILGMSRSEIRLKFDEIVAFAGLDRFIDTPVRRYSSGMSVRLAFAVAAHLEPEILLLDEVLAVGDADFQRKCLRKMGEVTQQEGRTILFVSHQLPSVLQLCDRVLVLNRGQLTHDTDATTGIAAYLAESAASGVDVSAVNLGDELALAALTFTPLPVKTFDDLSFTLQLRATSECAIHDLCLFFTNEFGQRVAIADLRIASGSYALRGNQSIIVNAKLDRVALVPGTYSVGLFIRTNRHMGDHHGVSSFEVQPHQSDGLMSYGSEHLGSVALQVRFDASVS